MVHVWSINSGERFQGHHGPLVDMLPADAPNLKGANFFCLGKSYIKSIYALRYC